MPPRPDSFVAMAWLRNATTRAASSSDSAPATHAAAISPCECPTHRVGRDTHRRPHRGEAHHHGEARRLHHVDLLQQHRRRRRRAARPPATSPPTAPARRHTRRPAPRTPARSPAAPGPCPTHCEPWPGNTHTSLPGVAALPATTPAAVSPRASAASPAMRLLAGLRHHHGTLAQHGPAGHQRPGHARQRRLGTGSDERRQPLGLTRPANRRSAPTPPTAPHPRLGTGSSDTGSVGGASSRIRCAFVPLIPNEDTPARRGRSVRGQSRACVSSSTAPADQSTSVVGCVARAASRAARRAAAPAPS